MKIDPELFSEFKNEVREIEKILKNTVNVIISSGMKDSASFEKYGQVVDRIYGTAATLGLKDFADYARTLKEVSYKCSQTKNEDAQKKVTRMLIEFLKYTDLACRCQNLNKEEEFVFNVQLNREIQRAKRLSQKELYGIERASCQKEV